jgi:hypothetical protein
MKCGEYRRTGEELTEAHATGCAECRQWLEEQRRLAAAMARLREQAASEPAPAGVFPRVLEEFDSVQRRRVTKVRILRASMAAGALAACLTVAWFWNVSHQPSAAPVVTAKRDTPPSLSGPAESPVPPAPVRRKARARPRPVVREAQQEEPFVAIPFTAPLAPYERTEVLRLDLPVAAVIAAGLPVRATDAAGRVQADVVVGQDGRARAIRLVSMSQWNNERSENDR